MSLIQMKQINGGDRLRKTINDLVEAFGEDKDALYNSMLDWLKETAPADFDPTVNQNTRLDALVNSATNTTYAAMKGATSAANGAAGLVPAPAKGKQGCFLRGDGAWVDIGSDITSASIKGKVITFTRRNGTTFTITLP